MRNFANDNANFEHLLNFKVIHKLIICLEHYSEHKELVLNISRILSKLSLDAECAEEIMK